MATTPILTAKRPKKKLYSLSAREVSLVDTPANLKKILILKGQGMSGDLAKDIQRKMASVDASVIESADHLVASLRHDPVEKAAGAAAAADDAASSQGLSEEAQGALKAVARILAPFADEISDQDMDALQAALGMASAPGEEPTDEEPPAKPATPATPVPAPEPPPARRVAPVVRVRKSKRDKDDDDEDEEVTESKEKNYKAKAGGDMGDTKEDTTEKVEKAAGEQLDRLEQIAKRATQLEEQNKELIAKSAKLETELAVEREDRLQREYLARASEYRALGDAPTLAKVLKSMHGAADEDRQQFEAVLKAANERVEKAAAFGGDLLGEIGSRQAHTGAGSAESRLNALVDSIVQKSAGGKTREQLYAEVMKTPEGSKLYAQAEADAGRGVH